MSTTDPFEILFVCAGNTSRSPFAAACAREELAKLDGGGWRVVSAGTTVSDESGPTDEARRLAAEFGLDLGSHRPRTVTAEDCRRADLIIAIGWDQASHVWSLVPDSWDRCFTLKEFVHYARRAPSRPAILYAGTADRMRDRVKAAHELRRRARSDHGFWGDLRPQDFDIPEPDAVHPDGWRTFARVMRLLVIDAMRLVVGPRPDPRSDAPKKKAARTRKAAHARPRSARRAT
ncbi:MAG TPA: hypothetical protein VM840_05105 [Actinomycetota bacterium]|nr:hypothetical protein [Actinomycetota bacterium]